MRKPLLAKQLEKTAAKLFQRTSGVQVRFESQMEQIALMSTAYGDASVLADFEEWAKTAKSRFPIADYLRVVDSRLGTTSNSVVVSTEDPEYLALLKVIHRDTGDFPKKAAVQRLLSKGFTYEDLFAMWQDYIMELPEDSNKTASAMIDGFFEDGGFQVVYMKAGGVLPTKGEPTCQ